MHLLALQVKLILQSFVAGDAHEWFHPNEIFKAQAFSLPNERVKLSQQTSFFFTLRNRAWFRVDSFACCAKQIKKDLGLFKGFV